MWHSVIGWVVPDVSKDHIAFIFFLDCWTLGNEGTMILQNLRNLFLNNTFTSQKTYSPTELLHLVTGYICKVYLTYYMDGFHVIGAFSFSYQL